MFLAAASSMYPPAYGPFLLGPVHSLSGKFRYRYRSITLQEGPVIKIRIGSPLCTSVSQGLQYLHQGGYLALELLYVLPEVYIEYVSNLIHRVRSRMELTDFLEGRSLSMLNYLIGIAP